MLKQNIYHFKWSLFFLSISMFLILLSFLGNILIFTDSFFFTSFENKLSYERITFLVDFYKKYSWINYVIIPVSLILKWGVLAGFIFITLLFFDHKIQYINCFKIVQLAEFVNVLANITKLFWFLVIKEPENIQDVELFYPLSVYQITKSDQLPKYFIYPLQQINAFELFYCFLLILGIKYFTNTNFRDALKYTVFGYGSIFILWILLIVFMQLQYS